MEDFLELEDGAQPQDLDQNSEQKLDDDQHISVKDLETSPEASIDRHRQPYIDRYRPDEIDRHTPDDINRHPSLDELPGYIVEREPVEEREYKFEASHLAVPKHLLQPIYADEAVGIHKRMKRIHDSVKIVVPCAVFEVEFPIPPDGAAHLSSYIKVFDDHQHAKASQRGLRFRSAIDKGPTEAASTDTSTSSSIDTGHVSEQNEFEVCRYLYDGGTTTRADKFGGKKMRERR